MGAGKRPWALRRLTAGELLECRAEARRGCGEDEAAFGLWCNAAVLARVLTRRARRRFRSAEEVLAALDAEEIARLAGEYERLTRVEPEGGVEALAERMAAQPYERLKWRVLRAFGALPTQARALEMTDADYLYCALGLALDGREARAQLCPDCRERALGAVCPSCGRAVSRAEGGENAAFDMAEFARRRDGA